MAMDMGEITVIILNLLSDPDQMIILDSIESHSKEMRLEALIPLT